MRRTRELTHPLPVAASPRVAGWLAAAPDGPVTLLHACTDAVHLEVDGHAVSVTGAGAPGLPQALRTNLFSLVSGDPFRAYVVGGILRWGGRALVTVRLVDVRAPRLDAARIPQTSPASAMGTPRPRGAGLVAGAPALPTRMDPATVPELVGLGEGLTPLGDDVLCGWLAAHRATGVPTPDVDDAVRRCLPRTSTLSATLLECALAGEVPDPVAGYLRSLGTPGEGAARTALEGLGHSSGRGLAHGLDLGLAALATELAA